MSSPVVLGIQTGLRDDTVVIYAYKHLLVFVASVSTHLNNGVVYKKKRIRLTK